MGCNLSNPDNQSAVEQEMVIIPLLTKPRQQPQEDFDNGTYFPFDSYNNSISNKERKETVENDMIEHATTNISTAPDLEIYKKQKFNECFSHIEVSTFQNVPIMSVQSHINMPSVEYQQTDGHEVDDYYQLIDQIVESIIPPLTAMTVTTSHELTI